MIGLKTAINYIYCVNYDNYICDNRYGNNNYIYSHLFMPIIFFIQL